MGGHAGVVGGEAGDEGGEEGGGEGGVGGVSETVRLGGGGGGGGTIGTEGDVSGSIRKEISSTEKVEEVGRG